MCYVLNDTVASKFTPAHRRSGEARTPPPPPPPSPKTPHKTPEPLPPPHHPAPSEKSAQKTG